MNTEPAGSESQGPAVLTVFADYVCPFSRLAQPLLARLEDGGVRTRRRAFQLRPEGTPLPQPDSRDLVAVWQDAVMPIARALGVEMRYPTRVPRTRKAHEAAMFARQSERHGELRRALYDAYFIEDRDIGRVDVLVEIGRRVGLDPLELKVALDIDRFADAVTEDEDLAVRLGVTGVPAFASSGELIQGLQPYGVLVALAHGEPTR